MSATEAVALQDHTDVTPNQADRQFTVQMAESARMLENKIPGKKAGAKSSLKDAFNRNMFRGSLFIMHVTAVAGGKVLHGSKRVRHLLKYPATRLPHRCHRQMPTALDTRPHATFRPVLTRDNKDFDKAY